jgi:hypothetical protein
MTEYEYEGLKQFCVTPKQREKLDAVYKHGSQRAAATALGVSKTTVQEAMASIRRRAAYKGFAPEIGMDHPQAEGWGLNATTGLYKFDNTTGERHKILEWVKASPEKEQNIQLIRDYVATLMEDVPARTKIAPPVPTPIDTILPAFVLGDPHCGMYAWADEAGDDYNLDIWSRQHRAAIHQLIDQAPVSQECIIVNLGDFFHAKNNDNRTQSGHALDVDTRYSKVFREGCATFEYMIDEALRKYMHVTAYVTEGNHDKESAFALAEVLRAYYRNEDRVTIKGGTAPREYHEFGVNFIGITHGHTAKPATLPAVMAAEQPEAWGRTKTRRWFVGHFHHQDRKEYPGCIVEIFPTLAGKDAWHNEMGYSSERAMTCVIFNRHTGEKGRILISIDDLPDKE